MSDIVFKCSGKRVSIFVKIYFSVEKIDNSKTNQFVI